MGGTAGEQETRAGVRVGHDWAGAAGDTFSDFRRQESTLVVLNLVVLAALLVVHVAFSAILGSPSRAVFLAIAAFFLLQALELIVLQSLAGPLTPLTRRVYSAVSVWVKLGFAVLIAMLGGFEDSHYAVLMVLPIAAAAFRFSFRGTLTVVTAAAACTFVELYVYYAAHPPLKLIEFYEAATLVLLYLVVALVVGYLAGQLRRDHGRLQASLQALEEARDRLVNEEKLAAVGRLAGAIAHEIRNPVAMIVSSAGLLQEGAQGGEARREMEKIVLGEALRLEKLTSDFLAYARVREPEPKPTRLSDALSYVAGVARARAQEAGQTLRVDCPRDGLVFVDPFQLQQALLNLLMNAMEASPAGSTIVLQGRLDGAGTLEVTVENPGDAIPAEVVDRLFEPFFSTKPAGTGLGLAIARNIARAHGGDLTLDAGGPGRVRFALHLPVARSGDAEKGG